MFPITLCLFTFGLNAQEDYSGSIPDMLRRPERGEAPRYPVDVVIGSLGQGDAPEEAYRFAREFLSELAAGNNETLEGREEIREIRPRIIRIGGGRIEEDGYFSFLVRFLGSSESITGELFIRQVNENWNIDALILEEKRALSEIRDNSRFDFSPYERFF